MSEKLSLLLRKIIREEIRTELQLFKKEIISELKSSTNKQPVREDRQPKPTPKRQPVPTRQKPTYSKNSTLQSILEDTDPLESSEPMVYGGMSSRGSDDLSFLLEDDDVPTPRMNIQPKKKIVSEAAGPDGEAINTAKPEVQNVLNVLSNTDFAAKLKAMNEAAKNLRQTM